MNTGVRLSEELLLRYVTGEASLEEIAMVALEMERSPETKQLVQLMEGMHNDGLLVEYDDPLPALSMAAVSNDNLCDILCEHFIRNPELLYITWGGFWKNTE